jgi:hypothetical protein
MALTDKLTAIADAIRSKSGKSAAMTLDQMPAEIEALKSEDMLPSVDLPDYVRKEAAEVAARVRAVLKNDSVVSIKISDTHYVGDTATSSDKRQTDIGDIHACMAIKALTYLLPIDYIAHLGDVGAGTISQDNPTHKKELTDFLRYFREAVGSTPVFVAIGNHDTAIYYHEEQKDGGIHTLSGDWLYDNFTALSESDDTVMSGENVGGYCYRDFPDKKLRVFLLNTSENLIVNQHDSGTSETQRLWVAKALRELNTKDDASLWGVVVLCHYAMDYGSTFYMSQVFKDYLDGVSHTENGETVDFSGYNGARFYAQFHGHWHNFKVDHLHADMNWTTKTLSPYGAWRLCTPNACYNQENTYKDKIVYGVKFGEDTAFHKTPNSANDTSFVVDVMNPSESKIYSFVYGAGYDREIENIGPVYYSISATLRHVTSSNDALRVEAGAAYVTTLAAVDGYELQSVIVKMGGEDITSAVYSNGVINITKVTGNIVIEATAIGGQSVVNQLPISTDTDGSIYNGCGYMAGVKLSKGDVATASGVYTSGFIPCKEGDTLYFKNCTMPDNNSNCRFSFFDSTKTYITSRHWTTANDSEKLTITYGADGNITTLTLTDPTFFDDVAYIRFCCNYLGADSIVTVNEPIE